MPNIISVTHKPFWTLAPCRKAMANLDSILEKQRHHFANKSLYSQSYGFSSSHVWMWEWDSKEGWVPKNWCFLIVVLETALECLLDSKEIKLVNLKSNQPWIFIGKTDDEAGAPILWPLDEKSWLIGKDLGAGKDWRSKEKGRQSVRLLKSITESVDMNVKLQQLVEDREPGVIESMRSQRVGHNLGTEQWQKKAFGLKLLWVFVLTYGRNQYNVA